MKHGFNEPEEFSFSVAEIKAMQVNWPRASDTTKALYYLGASGTVKLTSVVFSTWAQRGQLAGVTAPVSRVGKVNRGCRALWTLIRTRLKALICAPGDVTRRNNFLS